jgi:cell division protein FtsL
LSSVSARLQSRRVHRRPRRTIPRWFIGLGVIGILVVCVVAFATTFLELYRLQREADRLLRVRQSLQQETAVLREEIRALYTPEYIEKIAREQLGLVKPGEISVLIVQPPPKIPAPAPPPRARPSWLSQALRIVTRWLTR